MIFEKHSPYVHLRKKRKKMNTAQGNRRELLVEKIQDYRSHFSRLQSRQRNYSTVSLQSSIL